MDFYVDKAKSQFIDSNGKCRALIYVKGSHKIVMMTRPLPPFEKTMAHTIVRNPVAPIDVVVEFCKEMNLEIIKQHQEINFDLGTKKKKIIEIVGVTVTNPDIPILRSAYVMCKSNVALEGVKITKESGDTLFTSTSSAFDLFRRSRKSADIIMAYVLWTYSNSKARSSESESSFDFIWNDDDERQNFVVISPREIDDYEAEILSLKSRLFRENNTIIYSKNKIRVVSEEMITKLLGWLNARKVRNKIQVESYWEHKTIPDYFKTISDFSTSENQLVFVNRSGLEIWREGKIKSMGTQQENVVSTVIDINSANPYFYSSGTKIFLIQNVKDGSKELADFVASYWVKNNRNPGFNPKTQGKGTSKVISIESLEKLDQKSEQIPLISKINGKYFAILRIRKLD